MASLIATVATAGEPGLYVAASALTVTFRRWASGLTFKSTRPILASGRSFAVAGLNRVTAIETFGAPAAGIGTETAATPPTMLIRCMLMTCSRSTLAIPSTFAALGHGEVTRICAVWPGE